jgi:hypothetical protein
MMTSIDIDIEPEIHTCRLSQKKVKFTLTFVIQPAPLSVWYNFSISSEYDILEFDLDIVDQFWRSQGFGQEIAWCSMVALLQCGLLMMSNQAKAHVQSHIARTIYSFLIDRGTDNSYRLKVSCLHREYSEGFPQCQCNLDPKPCTSYWQEKWVPSSSNTVSLPQSHTALCLIPLTVWPPHQQHPWHWEGACNGL